MIYCDEQTMLCIIHYFKRSSDGVDRVMAGKLYDQRCRN